MSNQKAFRLTLFLLYMLMAIGLSAQSFAVALQSEPGLFALHQIVAGLIVWRAIVNFNLYWEQK